MKYTTQLLALLPCLLSFTCIGQSFDKQGHRGCRGLYPENSIPAMQKAVDLGVTLEMDISFSKEKIPLVSHDQHITAAIALKPNADTLSKAEEKALILYQMPYAEIRQYIFGRRFYPLFPQQKKVDTYIPKLADLIDSVERYSKAQHKPLPRYNIETKTTPAGDNTLHPGPEEFVKLMMQVIMDKQIADRVIIQSFDPRTLEIIHQKYPAIKTAFLVSNGDLEKNLAELSFKPDIYSPEFRLVNKELVYGCHAKQIKILPWTVDEQEDIDRMKSLQVDGIISDYPNLL